MTLEKRLVVTIRNRQSRGPYRFFHVYKTGEMLDMNKVKKILRKALIDAGYGIGFEK